MEGDALAVVAAPPGADGQPPFVFQARTFQSNKLFGFEIHRWCRPRPVPTGSRPSSSRQGASA
jgi:hypothetical protein